MLIVERRQLLLDHLREHGSAELDDLARALDVSASTIRRDLELLEKRGTIERTHGGAVFRGGKVEASAASGAGPPLATRMQEHAQAKRLIGAYAASLVEPGMTVMLDGGSTVVYAARQIIARPIQVVTNSLSICQVFKEDERVEVIVAGGDLYPRTEVMVGPIARSTLAELHADVLFISLAGIYGDAGFNINLEMARVERVMIRQAARSVMLMDASKFGRKSLVRVAGLAEFDEIVTDGAVDDAVRKQIGERLQVV